MKTVGVKLGTSIVFGALVVLFVGPPAVAQGVPPPAQIDILPPSPSEFDDIFIRVRGDWPDTCKPAPPVTNDLVDGMITLTTSDLSPICGQVITPYDLEVRIGHLASGLYHVTFTHCTQAFGCQRLGERIFAVVACPFPSRDVRRPSDINCGPDVGGTGHASVNFTGSAGSAGDTWLSVYDEAPDSADETILTGSVSLSADVLIHRFNNKKGIGLLALFNETPGPGQKGLALIVYDAGRTDTLALATVNEGGKLTTLRTMALRAGILKDAWYRMTMDVVVDGDDFTVTGRVFGHVDPHDPDSPLANPIDGELSTPTLSLEGLGLQGSGEVGVVASAFSAVVDSSLTNFVISQ